MKRVQDAMDHLNVNGRIHALSESARTAQEAADSLGAQVGQIASSLIFRLPSGGSLLIITSGRHRVNTDLVAANLGVEMLARVDATFVKEISGYSIGGVPPIGFVSKRLSAYPATLPLGKLLLSPRIGKSISTPGINR